MLSKKNDAGINTIVGKMFMTICHDIKKLSVLQDLARGIHH